MDTVRIPSRFFLVRFGGVSGSFGLAMGILAYHGWTVSPQNTNHDSTKLAWYTAEAYQKGTIRDKQQLKESIKLGVLVSQLIMKT